jgi:hypothetical protein
VNRRIILGAGLLVVLALSVTIATAVAAGGRLQLNLVSSGSTSTTFYPLSQPDCDNSFQKPAQLSSTPGTGVQYDSPGYAFGSSPHPSRFSYSVPAGGAFTVPASPDAVILKLWSFSGDGGCPGQDADQTIDWRLLCSGSCGTNVSLTGLGEPGGKPGWQVFDVPAGTPTNSLFNDHAGPSSAVQIAEGDTLTLELSADTWVGIQWSAPNGAGVSSLSILRQ